MSRAFNESWEMMPPPTARHEDFVDVDFLWISHQHPDHFNLPTLKNFPQKFKENVTVLFQKRNSEKILNAMRRFGYKNFVSLPHRELVNLKGVEFYCFLANLGDSCLGIRHEGKVVFNVNDAELDSVDAQNIVRDLGAPSVLLNQFSIAGYAGNSERQSAMVRSAQEKLFRISSNHKELQAKLTIPFASFVYFCREDNRDLNAYVNNPRRVSEHLLSQSCECLFLKPNENYSVGDQSNLTDRNLSAVDHYETMFSSISERPFLPSDKVSLQEIEKAYSLFYQRMGHHFSGVFRRFAGDLTCYLEDLGQAVCMSLGAKRFECVSKSPEQCDIVVNAQPLLFSLKFPWGFETLGVSGRYQVINARPWKLWKRISILENQELYLTPTSIFSRRNLRFLSERLRAGLLRNFRNRERSSKTI